MTRMERDAPALRWVALLGLVCAALVFLFAWAILPGRPMQAFLLGTGICLPFAAIIAAGIRGWRLRRSLAPTGLDGPPTPADAERPFEVDVSATSAAWRTSRRRAPIVAAGVGVAIGLWGGLGTVWWLGLAMGLVPAVVVPLLVAQDRPSLRAVESAVGPRALRVAPDGLHLPIECLAGGIVERASARGHADVHVRWEEITAWELYGHQHVVHVQPDAARYGPYARFAIVRVDEVAAQEEALIEQVRRYVRVPLEVRREG
jgi:hypothetical protein